MTEIQKRLTIMLKYFHTLCEKNNLKYYIIGGTLLGAVRHQGFIPWDDDIDVGMPRSDYERLISKYGNKQNDNYYLETPLSEDKNYCYPYSKLYDTNTTLIENTRIVLKRGIFLDIFPIDGIGNTEEAAKQNFDRINIKKNVLLLNTLKINKDRALHKNLLIYLARLLPVYFNNIKKLTQEIDNLCKNHSFESSSLVGNLMGVWGTKEIVSKEVFETPKLYNFENIQVFGVKSYDSYLTSIYGDWRTLPPIEKRITHHDYFLDLNKSYLKP